MLCIVIVLLQDMQDLYVQLNIFISTKLQKLQGICHYGIS